jgi:hypothetical protein
MQKGGYGTLGGFSLSNLLGKGLTNKALAAGIGGLSGLAGLAASR